MQLRKMDHALLENKKLPILENYAFIIIKKIHPMAK